MLSAHVQLSKALELEYVPNKNYNKNFLIKIKFLEESLVTVRVLNHTNKTTHVFTIVTIDINIPGNIK